VTRVVGILGGTFDPPHVGHLGVARNVLASGAVEQVWLVPCVEHAFGKQPAAFEHRLALCRLLIEGEPGVTVSDVEAEVDSPGRTLDLVRFLDRVFPGTAFRLIAGSDIYHERQKWHRYDEVARLAPPIYVERAGEAPIPEPTLPAPPAVSSQQIRAALACGERPVELVPARLLDYIEVHRLYGVDR
jgi:nicotinate-nucleotide adenylyltransferase